MGTKSHYCLQTGFSQKMTDKNLDGNSSPVNPFFVVGCVRSGTTLLRLLLGHHPSICKCEEFDFAVEFPGHEQRATELSEFHYYLEHHRGFRLSGYSIDKTLDFTGLMHSFLRQRQAADTRPVVGATVHSNFHKLVQTWPEAKFVYLRRDPRNVSRSIVKEGWAGTTWHGTLPWIQAEAGWRNLRASIGDHQWIEIRYEDLIEDTRNTLDKVLGHLELEYDPEMLEIERDTTYKRPNPDEAQHWSASATPVEIRLVEACAGKYLSDAGYEPSELPPLTIGKLDKLSLNLRNRYNMIKFFIKRNGLVLWLLAITSRRLPFKGLRTDVQLRIDTITNRHMK